MSTEDHKLYNTKALATYFVFMTETCTPSLPLPGPHRPADLKTSVREKSANCWRENLLLDLFAAITDCLSFFVSSADFHVPSEYLTNIHIRDKVTATVIITCSIITQRSIKVVQAADCFAASLPQLAAIKLARYGEDLLFYLYYMNGGDLLQLLAAVEL